MPKDGSTRVCWLWLPLVVSCLLATSCSFLRLGYDFFPTWALWEIDSYLNLDTEQRLIARRRLVDLHDWHRQSQLPSYIEFISSLRKQALASITEKDAGSIRERVLAAWNPVAERLAPGVAELLLTVQPDQIVQMKKAFAKGNRKLRAEYLPSDRLAARAKRLRERLEYFLGDLSEAQERRLRQLSDAMPASEELRLDEREARQQRFLRLIERLNNERPPQARAEQLSRDFLISMWTSQDKDRQARIDASSRANDALTAEIVSQASPAQQGILASRLLDWEATFARMIRTER